MRILQLISSTGFYGAENAMVLLSKELCSAGNNVYIGIIGNRNDSYLTVIKAADEYNLGKVVFNCNSKLDFKCILGIRKYIKKNAISIIHSHGYKSNFYSFLSVLGLPVKNVATCHNWLGKSPRMRFYSRLDKLILSKFDKIVGVSNMVYNQLVSSGVVRSKVLTIDNGIDTRRFQVTSSRQHTKETLGIKRDEKVVGTVGRLTQEKGHVYLLEAFTTIIKMFPNTKLLIVGDGPLKDKLKTESCRLQIDDKVIFTGMRNDIPEMLYAMDLFVLPSLDEGMPMALLEAMAAKKTIIATKVGAVPKMLDDETSGILIRHGDINELIASINSLLRDRNRAVSLAQNAYKKVSSEFSEKKMAEKYIEVYHSLIDKRC